MARTTAVKSFMVKPSVLTEARTLTDSDSGKTYFLNAAVGFEVTLPAPRGGVNFTFIVKTTPTSPSDYVIGAKGDAKIIIGQVITSNIKAPTDAEFERSGASHVKFLSPDARVGDSVEMISDGTYSWTGVILATALGFLIIGTYGTIKQMRRATIIHRKAMAAYRL